MKSLAHYFALLLALLVHSNGQGAEMVLRKRATQHGTVIRLGDIADLSATSSAELRGLASTPLMPAPAVGTQQFLSASQVRELLVARGIRLDRLNITGAKVVEIGDPVELPKADAKPKLIQPTKAEVELRVQQAIERHLRDSASASRWRVEVLLNPKEVLQVVNLGGNFSIRGQRQLRSGRQRFLLGGEQGQKQVAVTATLTQFQSVVIVKRRIERGQLVRTADVELSEREGNLPSGSFTDLQQAIGQEAQRALRPEEILQKGQVRAPWLVRRGETVNVYVRTGGIVVRTRATSKQNGAMGELIALETLEGRKRLDASVSGPGEVVIHATGGRTTDYAMLNRDDRQRR